MIIYGLETCTLCQRAKKTLEDNGISVFLRDIRADPLLETELMRFAVHGFAKPSLEIRTPHTFVQ